MNTWILVMVISSSMNPSNPVVEVVRGFSTKTACESVAKDYRSHDYIVHGQWLERTATCVK